jgi:ferredoxin
MNFTGAMKNLFGLVPSVVKSSFHVRFPSQEKFAAMITDLNLAVKAHYAFMDAVVGMEGPGPAAGSPRHIGLVLASSNLLALDAAACRIIGYSPANIPVSREALSRKFWLRDFSEIEYPGLHPDDVKVPNFVKVPLKKSGSQLLGFILPRRLRRFRESLVPRPEIRRDICVRCGDCARICASGAIAPAGKEKHMVITHEKCIRCYCCHEICPLNAIDIKKVSIRQALFGGRLSSLST